MNRKLNKKGFTLIEVVLVLAIGGLIFLLAFLAFQQVQKNRRDTQRRSDAARVVTEVANYSGDHNGALPTGYGWVDFIQSYLGWDSNVANSKFTDPEGENYVFDNNLDDVSDVRLTIGTGVTGGPVACDGSTLLGTKDYKVEIKLESGTACRDNGK